MKNNMKISFYLFGDSICYGQFVSPHQTWAVSLSASLNAISNLGRDILFQNVGVNGNTTKQALDRMHYDVTSHRPDYLMIQFGINDCNYWATDNNMPRVSKKTFVANLEEIVERAMNSGTHHCLINTNHPLLKGEFEHFPEKTHSQTNAEYNNLIRVAHNKMSSNQWPVTLIDIEATWKSYLEKNPLVSLKDLLLTDGVHLSLLGHNVYNKSIVPLIVSKFKASEESKSSITELQKQ